MTTQLAVSEAEIIRMRNVDKLSYPAIEERTGVGRYIARRICRNAGVVGALSPAQDKATEKAHELGHPNLEAALTVLAPTHLIRELADMFQVHDTTMSTWLRRWHIAPKQAQVRNSNYGSAQPVVALEPQPEPEPEPQLRADPRRLVMAVAARFYYRAPTADGQPIKLALNERWCKCGETMTGGFCYRCGSRGGIDPRRVLLPGEWTQ